MSDEFYVGHLPNAPPRLARFVRRTVVGLLALAVVLATLIAVLQPPFDDGTFEFGLTRTFSGTLDATPYPTLLVRRPGLAAPGVVGASPYSLVGFGKFTDRSEVTGREGQVVELDGSLVYNRRRLMIEVDPGSVEETENPSASVVSGVVELGTYTLVGEIVDAKCFLGVMKPGRGKTHRACASLCIRGGIPPMLLVETVAGERRSLLLVDEAGQAVNDRVLDHVAEPVQITGRVRRDGETLYLVADPGTYKRVM